MHSSKTTFAIIVLLTLSAMIGCTNSHVRSNRETVWPLRVQREVLDEEMMIKIETNDEVNEGAYDFNALLYETKSSDGQHNLGLNLNFNEETKIVTGSASGVILTHDGYILTNHHVTKTNPSKIEVVLRQGDDEIARSAELIAYSPFDATGNDLAVIKVNTHFDHVAHLGEVRQIYESAKVYNWGYPFSLSENALGRCYNLGHVSKTWITIPFFSKQRRFLMGIRGAGGVSGSGIFARDGRLVGIMQGHTGYGLYMVGIPIDQIRIFLDEYGIPYSG